MAPEPTLVQVRNRTHIGLDETGIQIAQQQLLMVTHANTGDKFCIELACNPHWNEIQQQLLPHETAIEQRDLIQHVFDLKKQQLLDELRRVGYSGAAITRLDVIHYTKRGLPHTHTLSSTMATM